MYYKEYGAEHSKMIVFIHGGGVSGWMWDQQVAYFSQRYHCMIQICPSMEKAEEMG